MFTFLAITLDDGLEDLETGREGLKILLGVDSRLIEMIEKLLLQRRDKERLLGFQE